MLGELSPDEIERLLNNEFVGRLGYRDGEQINIVPINYAYDGACIYAHSKEGVKIKRMRENPLVCFEVDKFTNMNNWQSVIAWGSYEELTDPLDHQAGMKIILSRFTPFENTSETFAPMKRQPEPHPVGATYKPVAFRIRISHKTGRYERS